MPVLAIENAHIHAPHPGIIPARGERFVSQVLVELISDGERFWHTESAVGQAISNEQTARNGGAPLADDSSLKGDEDATTARQLPSGLTIDANGNEVDRAGNRAGNSIPAAEAAALDPDGNPATGGAPQPQIAANPNAQPIPVEDAESIKREGYGQQTNGPFGNQAPNAEQRGSASDPFWNSEQKKVEYALAHPETGDVDARRAAGLPDPGRQEAKPALDTSGQRDDGPLLGQRHEDAPPQREPSQTYEERMEQPMTQSAIDGTTHVDTRTPGEKLAAMDETVGTVSSSGESAETEANNSQKANEDKPANTLNTGG